MSVKSDSVQCRLNKNNDIVSYNKIHLQSWIGETGEKRQITALFIDLLCNDSGLSHN